MAAYIGFQPNDYYNTKLYTGDGTAIGSGGQAITGVGFQSDLTWLKNRASPGTQGHQLFDAVRGATNVLWPEDAGAQGTRAESLASWQSDGFTLGSDGDVNYSSSTYASWNWKAGTTSGISGGSITPTGYSLSTTAGQSIIAYTGTGSAATVPHGLGVTPEFIIVKDLTGTNDWAVYHQKSNATPEDYFLGLNVTDNSIDNAAIWNDTAPTSTLFSIGTGSTATVPHGLGATPGMIIVKRVNGSFGWVVYHHKNTSAPETDYLMLNTNVATDDDVNVWNDTAPTSSVFTVKTSNMNNSGSGTYVAYCFAPVKGYSQFGGYTGNGNADGPVVHTGFRPNFLMIKKTSGTGDWVIFDSVRSPSNVTKKTLLADTAGAEGNVSDIDILSNGFKLRYTDSDTNTSAGNYIFIAFAEFPFVSSNSKPGTAR